MQDFRMKICKAFAFALLTFAAGCDKTPARPNVILISVDTLRADHLSCYGYAVNTSPNIDEFAERSIFFENAYSPTHWTAPAHMSIFTGLYPSVHKVNVHPIPAKLNDDIKTMTQYLKEGGYNTFGVYYGEYLSPDFGFGKGYDSYTKTDMIKPALQNTLSFLDGRDAAEKPFFIFFHVGDTHQPYMQVPPKDAEYRTLYDPAYEGKVVEGNKDEMRAMFKELQAGRDISRDVAHLEALYDGAIRYTDVYIGRLLDELKKRNLYDSSIIIFTSDHGEEFFEHGVFGHNSLHKNLIHVPLIMKLPDSVADRLDIDPVAKYDYRVRLLDIMPTLLNLLDVPLTSYADGASLVPMLQGKGDMELPVYGESEMYHLKGYRSQASILDKKFQFIEYQKPLKQEKPDGYELYSNENDPWQRYDLAPVKTDSISPYKNMVRRWQNDMEKERKKVTSEVGEQAPVNVTEEQIEHLKALGYIQ